MHHALHKQQGNGMKHEMHAGICRFLNTTNVHLAHFLTSSLPFLFCQRRA